MLLDKRQKDWLNAAAKSQLWKQAGEQQEPPATGAQCKKLYDNTRTRVGKIMNKEKKSGAWQPERSVKDQEIMDTSGFQTQNIVRGITHPSEQFAIQGSSETVTGTDEEELDDDLSSAGSHAPYIRSKGKGIGKRSSLSSAAASTSGVASAPSITKTDLNEAVMQMLSKADSMGHTLTYSGHRRIVHDFTCLLEGHMLAIPEDSWHDFEIDCLNLVQRFRQRGQATQQQQQHQQQAAAATSNLAVATAASLAVIPAAAAAAPSIMAVLTGLTLFAGLTAANFSLATVDRYHWLGPNGNSCPVIQSSPSVKRFRTVCRNYSPVFGQPVSHFQDPSNTNCLNARVRRHQHGGPVTFVGNHGHGHTTNPACVSWQFWCKQQYIH